MADDERTEEIPRVTEEKPAPKPSRLSRVGADLRSSRLAQVLTGVLAVLIVGGIGYGIGYAVGDSGHHDRHRPAMMRDDFGPPGPRMHNFERGPGGPGGMPPGGPGRGGENTPNTTPAPTTAPAPTTS